MRTFFAASLLVLLTAAAQANSYDDFTRALQASRAGKTDEAIAAYTAALKNGDLAKPYLPDAYFGRSTAYLSKGQCTEAINDIDKALELRPNYRAIELRMTINACLKKQDAVMADANHLISIMPADAASYTIRGDLFWGQGQFKEAAADYRAAANRKPIEPYNLIWYAISAARIDAYDTAWFDKSSNEAGIDGWPAVLVEFIRGKRKTEDVYRAAERGEGEVPQQQKCEADFYIGEWHLATKQNGARALIELAAKECPKNFKETYLAKRELERLP